MLFSSSLSRAELSVALSESDESQRTTYTWSEGWGGGAKLGGGASKLGGGASKLGGGASTLGGGASKLGGGASRVWGGASSLLEEEGLVGGLSEGLRR